MDNGNELQWEKGSKELEARLYEEFGMTEESVKTDIEHIQTWLSKQPHLPPINDDLIETFLFNCKNSLEATKLKLDQYFTAKATMPEYFTGRDATDPKLQKNMYYAPLPKLTKDGCRVLLIKLYDPDPANFQPLLVNKAALMLCDLLMRYDKNAGTHVVYDTEGLTLAHTGAVTIRMTKNFIQCTLTAYPHRVRAIHVISSSPVTHAFVNFNKMFVKDKTKHRIVIHEKGAKSLLEHINEEVLPKEYGGTYDYTMQEIRDVTQKYLEDNRDLFLEDEKIVADLSKKIDSNGETGYEESQLFGVEGSFRHIHID